MAGVAMLNGAISPQIYVRSRFTACCTWRKSKSSLPVVRSSTAARRLMILGTPLPRFLPSQTTIFESSGPQSQSWTRVVFPGQIGQARVTDKVTR